MMINTNKQVTKAMEAPLQLKELDSVLVVGAIIYFIDFRMA